MSCLIDRSMIYITGKGGVGRSTVATAVAMAAGRAGKRVVIVEVGSRDRTPGTTPEPSGIDNLWTLTIDPQKALEEWLSALIGSQTLAGMLSKSNTFAYFVAAAPGVRELVTLTKAWELSRQKARDQSTAPFDLVIVDGGASGHGLGMLRTPQTYAEIARIGPISTQATRVKEFLSDPEAIGYIAVTRPEETPISETLELEEALLAQLGRALDVIIVNGVLPRQMTRADLHAIEEASAAPLSADARAAIATARTKAGWRQSQMAQISRLRGATKSSVATLAFIGGTDLGLKECGELSLRLPAVVVGAK